MSNSWARASDGSINIYPSESGMVGTLNSHGAWVTWVPPIGVRFDAEYYGKTISVKNQGEGVYALTMQGAVSLHRYLPRWLSASYFDADANPVAGYDAATAAGEPRGLYETAGEIVMTSQPVATPPPVTVAPPVNWTRSSDGRDHIWASESGMVAAINLRGCWGAWKPGQGITYQSHYHGETIAVRNEGDGSYSYQAPNDQTTLRRYADRWGASTYWDARGNPVAGFEDAAAQGDPDAIFYAVGAVYSPTTVQTVNPPPVATVNTPTSTVPTSTAPTVPGNVVQFPGSVNTLPISNPANSGGNVPAVVPFPDGSPIPGTAPAEPISTGKIVLWGLAAWAALKGF
jgi:hypothetical protein